MTILVWSLILVLALAALLEGGKILTEATEKMGRILGFSSFLSGALILTTVSSLPELLTALFASGQEESAYVPANIVGTNIVNLLLISALVALLGRSIKNQENTWTEQVPLLLASTFLLTVLMVDGQIVWLEGLLFLLTFAVYLKQNHEMHAQDFWDRMKLFIQRERINGRLVGIFLLSLTVVLTAAYFTVESVLHISESLSWSSSILAGTIVALGTALPELVIAFHALRKKQIDLALGNLVGSSMVNATLVLGLSSLLSPLNVTSNVLGLGLPYLLITVFLFAFLSHQKTWSRYEGVVMISLYLVFFVQFLNPSL